MLPLAAVIQRYNFSSHMSAGSHSLVSILADPCDLNFDPIERIGGIQWGIFLMLNLVEVVNSKSLTLLPVLQIHSPVKKMI